MIVGSPRHTALLRTTRCPLQASDGPKVCRASSEQQEGHGALSEFEIDGCARIYESFRKD